MEVLEKEIQKNIISKNELKQEFGQTFMGAKEDKGSS